MLTKFPKFVEFYEIANDPIWTVLWMHMGFLNQALKTVLALYILKR